MADDETDKPAPRMGERALAEHAARRAREAAALRENLRRRKEQVRAREATPPHDEPRRPEDGKPGT